MIFILKFLCTSWNFKKNTSSRYFEVMHLAFKLSLIIHKFYKNRNASFYFLIKFEFWKIWIFKRQINKIHKTMDLQFLDKLKHIIKILRSREHQISCGGFFKGSNQIFKIVLVFAVSDADFWQSAVINIIYFM